MVNLSAAPSNVNPWRAAEQTSPNWARLKNQVVDETGLDIQAIADKWRLRAESEVPDAAKPRAFRLADAELQKNACARLAVLSARSFEASAEHATAPLWLQRASRAPLVDLGANAPTCLHVLADLGGGRALRVVVREFGEEATAVNIASTKDCYTLDGADFRAWCFPMYDELLEGPLL